MKKIYLDLVTTKGEIVRVECPGQFENELHDTIEAALKRREWWAPGQFDGCSATFLQLRLERVNMGEIVGTL